MIRTLAAFLALALLCGCAGETGPFPSKEIRIIVQSPPGGLSDQILRVMGSLIKKDFDIPLVAENRPGAPLFKELRSKRRKA